MYICVSCARERVCVRVCVALAGVRGMSACARAGARRAREKVGVRARDRERSATNPPRGRKRQRCPRTCARTNRARTLTGTFGSFVCYNDKLLHFEKSFVLRVVISLAAFFLTSLLAACSRCEASPDIFLTSNPCCTSRDIFLTVPLFSEGFFLSITKTKKLVHRRTPDYRGSELRTKGPQNTLLRMIYEAYPVRARQPTRNTHTRHGDP